MKNGNKIIIRKPNAEDSPIEKFEEFKLEFLKCFYLAQLK